MHVCDFCGKETTLDKIICKRCHGFLSHLLATFQESKEEKEEPKKQKRRERIKKSKKSESPKEKIKEEMPAEKTERQKKFEKFSKKKQDPLDLLTKCATCELSFLDPSTGKISCTDRKEPKTCGR